jgi:hypothetical protein
MGAVAFLSYFSWIMKVAIIIAVGITSLNFKHLFYSGKVEELGLCSSVPCYYFLLQHTN